MSLHAFRCAILVFLAGWTCLGHSAEPTQSIHHWVLRLNSDRFRIRQQAYLELLQMGPRVIPELKDVADSSSAEQRHRIRRLVRQIRFEALKQGFAKVVSDDDAAIDLDQGMILIARMLDINIDGDAIKKQLDELADAVRRRLGDDVVPQFTAPQDVVDALIAVLRDDFRLSGNVIDYDNPKNSSLKHVLATRKGLPILISHVAVSIGERLEVPIVGLSIPGRYMIKYDGSRAPLGHPREDIIIDPFGAWRIVSVDEIKVIIRSFDFDEHLVPCPRRDSLARMIRNLISDLLLAGEADQAADAQRILLRLENGRFN